MSNIFIARPQLSDLATITSSNVDPDHPIENLQTQQPRDFMRTVDDTDWHVTIDMGAGAEVVPDVQVIGLLYTNADDNTQWRVRGANSESNLTAIPGYDSGTIDHWPESGLDAWGRTHALLYLSTVQQWRWWRIDITTMNPFIEYYQAGRIYIAGGDYLYHPTRNVDIGLKIGFNDSSSGIDTPGAHYRRSGKQWRSVAARFSFRFEAEAYDKMLVFDRTVGMGGDVLVCANPDSRIMERLMYCYPESFGALDHGVWNVANASNLHTKQYNFTEFELP